MSSVYIQSGQHSLPACRDPGFLPSASIISQALGWCGAYSGGTWKATGGMGTQRRENQLRPGLCFHKRGNIRDDKWGEDLLSMKCRQIFRAQKGASARHDHQRRWWLLRTPGGSGLWERLAKLGCGRGYVSLEWPGILEVMEDFHRPGWGERSFQWSAGGDPTYPSDWTDVCEGEIEKDKKGCLPWPRSLNCTWTCSVGGGQLLGVFTPGSHLCSNTYHIILWYLSPCQTAFLLICSFRK